jgi:hypothetical protein
MSDYEWIHELKEKICTEEFVKEAESKLGNRAIIEQIIEASRQHARKQAILELRTELADQIRKKIEPKLIRQIEVRLTKQIEARLTKQIELKLSDRIEPRVRRELQKEVAADFKAQLKDLVDFGGWFSWKALRFKRLQCNPVEIVKDR